MRLTDKQLDAPIKLTVVRWGGTRRATDLARRALRAEQERDEAYEPAAVKVRDVLCCMDWPPSNGDDLIDTLQTAIRRLASGPEKIAAVNDGEERK